MDWFAGVAEEELLYYTGVGNDVDSLWAVIGSFVPPPPRPPYLPEESIATDGLTTCDLCSWAWRNDRHSFSLDGTLGESYIFQSIRIFHRLLFPFKRYAVWFRRVLQAVRKIIVFISVPAFCLTQLFFKYFDFASKCFNWSALSRFERDSLSGTSRSAIEMGCFIGEAVRHASFTTLCPFFLSSLQLEVLKDDEWSFRTSHASVHTRTGLFFAYILDCVCNVFIRQTAFPV